MSDKTYCRGYIVLRVCNIFCMVFRMILIYIVCVLLTVYSLPFCLVNFSISSCFSTNTLSVAKEHNHIWYVLLTVL